jgi:hypothetical protein
LLVTPSVTQSGSAPIQRDISCPRKRERLLCCIPATALYSVLFTSVTTAIALLRSTASIASAAKATLVEAIQARCVKEWGPRPGELLAACLVPVVESGWTMSGCLYIQPATSGGGRDMIHDSRKVREEATREAKASEEMRR